MKLPKAKSQLGKRRSSINTWETPTFCSQVEMEDGETNKRGGIRSSYARENQQMFGEEWGMKIEINSIMSHCAG